MGKDVTTVHLEDDIIKVVAIGNVNEAATAQLIADVSRCINELQAQHKKVVILIDQSRVTAGDTTSRRMAVDFFKHVSYDRIAIFDSNRGHRNATHYLINTIGPMLRIKTFKSERIALAWLRHAPPPPKTKARRALALALSFTVLAGLWQFVWGPQMTRLPDNYNYNASVVSYDNFYDETAARFSGRTLSNTQFSYSATGSQDGVVNIKNVFDVRTSAGEPIFAVERLYGIDRTTRQHVPERGDHPRNGYLFAPRHLAKEDFVYWHVNYDEPAVMKFQGEEDILGLKTYRYKADFHADQTKDLKHISGVGVDRGINLDISLQLWVEPTTGHLIKYEDFTTAYFYDLTTGRRLNPWNQFQNTYSFESIVTQVQRAEQDKRRMIFAEMTMPVLLVAAALVCLARWAVWLHRDRALAEKSSRAQLETRDGGGIAAGRKGFLLSLVVVSVMLLITVLAWQQALANSAKQATIRFRGDVHNLHSAVTHELRGYVQVLESTRGLFAASNEVSRDEWKSFTDSLALTQQHPGIVGVGFARVVPLAQKDAYVNEIRRDGFSNFTVFPEGVRDTYVPVTYLEPSHEGNQRAFGFDMFADPVRREAMERARDTGEPAMSGKVSLIQETGADPQGVLIFAPIYQKGRPITTVDERKAALVGFVYAPVKMSNLVLVTIGNQTNGLNISLFDTPDAGSLSVDNRLFVADKQYGIENTTYHPRLAHTESTTIAGRQLIFRYTNLPSYNSVVTDPLPDFVLYGGTILSCLVGLIMLLLSSARARALKLANSMTIDLRNERNRAVITQHKDEAILGSIGDGVFVVDNTGRIKLFNKAAELICGVSAKQVLNRPYKEVLSFYNELTGAEADQFIQQALGGRVAEMARHTALKRPDGHGVPVADSAAPIVNNKGIIEGVVVVFRDISSERQLERAKDEFLSMASHELRTPMGAVRANLSMMLSGDYGPVNKGLVEPLADAHNSTVRLVELVNDLLDASRIEAGRMRFVVGQYDLRPLIKKITTDLVPLAKERGLKLSLTAGESAMVQVDPERLRQVVTNLAGNALKFTDKGSITLAIAVQDNVAEVTVTDTGIGIAPNEQAKLFGKFSQISSAQAGKPAGTGLGLYISREIMHKMGGELWIKHSAAGKGSTFALTIPLIDTPLAKKIAKTLEQEAEQHPDQK